MFILINGSPRGTVIYRAALPRSPERGNLQLILHAASIASSDLDRSFDSVAVNSFDICIHFICRTDNTVDSQFVNAEDVLTLDECLIIVQDKMLKAMINPEFRRALDGPALPGNTVLEDFVKGPESDLFVFYDKIQPIVREIEKETQYETIGKYSFLDQKKYVKIYIPLDGIGEVPPAKIFSRFLDRSVEVKIHDYQGKNWIFAIPKTQCLVLTKESKIIQKKDKLIVCLGKMAEADNWFSLHKTRCIGDKELD